MDALRDSWKDRTVERLYSEKGVTGAIAILNRNGKSVHTECNDLLLILVFEADLPVSSIYHYIKDGIRIQERHLSKRDLEKRALSGEDRAAIYWITQGEIWVDRNTELASLRAKLLQFPPPLRELKLLAEFSLFLRRYIQCKEYLQSDHILDAYSSILRAIHHWARIAIIEKGVHPEIMVWGQIRQLNPGVYKIYEELTTSSETLKQRIELVLLACEFSVMSKMESCCRPVLRILEECENPLGIGELLRYAELQRIGTANLPLIMAKLAQKQLIKEVVVLPGEDLSALEVKYTKRT